MGGILQLLNTYLPEAKIILMPRINVSPFDTLVHHYWPDVRILHTHLVDEDSTPDAHERSRLDEVMGQVDFILGGKGETGKVQWLTQHYDKPYGLYGVAVKRPPTGALKQFLDKAAFCYVRETISAENLKKAEVKCIAGFAPDASFGCTIEDDWNAVAFMREHGLEHKKFICFENHCPILACVQGTPAFYLRQPEDTIKGQMWYDIGLSDWIRRPLKATFV